MEDSTDELLDIAVSLEQQGLAHLKQLTELKRGLTETGAK